MTTLSETSLYTDENEPSKPPLKLEKLVIWVVAIVQFVNIVDFMMVMPLGPDFGKALGIRVSHLGVIAGSYTLAAALSGLLCSFFIDRIDRKLALGISMVGLSVGTAAGAFAFDFHSLLWARVLAGVFGGPAASTGMAMISDVVPHHRRGAAIGTVMMAFSLASTFGVPLGLELAQIGTWQLPFFVLGFLSFFVAVFIFIKLPRMDKHLAASKEALSLRSVVKSHYALLTQGNVVLSYVLIFSLMMSGFLIFPNIAGYVQENLDFPRDQMGRLYLVGGLASLIVMRIVGILVDRFGSAPLFMIGTCGFIVGLVGGFWGNPPFFGPYWIFLYFMAFGTVRNISSNTLTSKVPKPDERAGFMSLQSAFQHLAAACGGILSSRLLSTGPDGDLLGVQSLVYASLVSIIISVITLFVLNRRVSLSPH